MLLLLACVEVMAVRARGEHKQRPFIWRHKCYGLRV